MGAVVRTGVTLLEKKIKFGDGRRVITLSLT
jgi:hypothetical protein